MYADLNRYIDNTWPRLRRSTLDPLRDPKVPRRKDGPPLLYIPQSEKIELIREMVAARAKITGKTPPEVRYLPKDWSTIPPDQHGVIYQPNDIFVPVTEDEGSSDTDGELWRFNEAYGWDTDWIEAGLLRAGHTDWALGAVRNQFNQIDNFGYVLNGTRTYYQRSHPPVLSMTVQDIAAKLSGSELELFLLEAERALSLNYRNFWKKQRFQEYGNLGNGRIKSGLFHYGHIDMAKYGPCVEVMHGEIDENGMTHYDRLRHKILERGDKDEIARLINPLTGALSDYAIACDWAVRESGFDPSMHLGFCGMEALDTAPVCLNALLKMQCDLLSELNAGFGRSDRARRWADESAMIAANMREYLRNEQGLFRGLNMRTGKLSEAPFLTCGYPLLAGLVSKEEAEHILIDIWKNFFTARGLRGAPQHDGTQWSEIWAPLNDLISKGAKRYGFDILSVLFDTAFLTTVAESFKNEGNIREKYPVEDGAGSIVKVLYGYAVNVIGFGWTDGTCAKMIERLKEGMPFLHTYEIPQWLQDDRNLATNVLARYDALLILKTDPREARRAGMRFSEATYS